MLYVRFFQSGQYQSQSTDGTIHGVNNDLEFSLLLLVAVVMVKIVYIKLFSYNKVMFDN